MSDRISRSATTTRALRAVAIGLAALAVVIVGIISYARRSTTAHPPTYVAADTSLRAPYFYLYPSRTAEPARAVIVLFGNDIAFWEPHQDLAWRFSGDGYDVIGLDLRKYLATLPEPEPQRDSAFAANITAIIARARRELHADSLPLIVGGHSFGAEIAFWLAWRVPPPKLVGVLSLNSRSSGHLFITPSDWMNKEASGPWSFSVVQAAHDIEPNIRIALVRSSKDPFKVHDPDFVAAGGARLRRYEIPMASHSLTTMLVAGPLISRAVRFLLDSTIVKGH
jgi:pimeloyl-ACP methyl ester carboxylesterase